MSPHSSLGSYVHEPFGREGHLPPKFNPAGKTKCSCQCGAGRQAGKGVSSASIGHSPRQGFQVASGRSTLPTFSMQALAEQDSEEVEQFLGGLKKAVKSVGKTVSGAARSVASAAQTAAKAAAPVVKQVQRTATTLATPPASGAAIGLVRDVARGKNVVKAFKAAAKAGVTDVRDRLRLAQMAASMVPGAGTGFAVPLAFVNGFADGRPFGQSLIRAARAAIPMGPLGQAGFDLVSNAMQGRSLSVAALSALRNRLPPAAQVGFDTGLALYKGQNFQQAAGQLLKQVPRKSRYFADPTAFVKNIQQGKDVQAAALTTQGRQLLESLQSELDYSEYEMDSVEGRVSPAEMELVDQELARAGFQA